MKLNIYTEAQLQEERIDIHCREKTDKITSVIDTIKDSFSTNIIGILDDTEYVLTQMELLYFESVDKKCFAYTKDNTYQVKTTLNKLEADFATSSFARISKSAIVNLYKIRHIKADLNMRTVATLHNGEMQIITRHYKKTFNQKLYALRDQIKGGTDGNH